MQPYHDPGACSSMRAVVPNPLLALTAATSGTCECIMPSRRELALLNHAPQLVLSCTSTTCASASPVVALEILYLGHENSLAHLTCDVSPKHVRYARDLLDICLMTEALLLLLPPRAWWFSLYRFLCYCYDHHHPMMLCLLCCFLMLIEMSAWSLVFV